MFITFSLH